MTALYPSIQVAARTSLGSANVHRLRKRVLDACEILGVLICMNIHTCHALRAGGIVTLGALGWAKGAAVPWVWGDCGGQVQASSTA